MQLRFESREALYLAYLQALTAGGFPLPTDTGADEGAELPCTFLLPAGETLACTGRVAGGRVTLLPNAAFAALIDREKSARRAGRSQGDSAGGRTAPRYETCLDVGFDNLPELSRAYAINISRGGLFVRTERLLPLRSFVSLTIRLPGGEAVESEAEVVHVVSPQEAQAKGVAPGVGLSFGARNAAFFVPINRLLEAYRRRRPRVLAVLGGPPAWRGRLLAELEEAQLEVTAVSDAATALARLPKDLCEVDLLLLDAAVEGATGLIDASRAVGGDSDLRVAVLAQGRPLTSAHATLDRWSAPSQLAGALLGLLGRAPEKERPAASPRFGNFELIALLGTGGMASVFKARVLDGRRAGQLVALKRLHDEFAEDVRVRAFFEREAAVSQLLTHPNIIKVYECGERSGIAYMSMEWVEGTDLGRLLSRCREQGVQVPVDVALYVAVQLFRALDFAHTAHSPLRRPLDIVHCDVSSSNLFLSAAGEVKLGDFGVAHWRVGDGADGQAAGKPHYASPELLDGKIDRGVDLWAGAVVLYEMLTLARPFQGKSAEQVLSAVRKAKWTSPRKLRKELAPGVKELFDQCFAKDPKKRIQTAAALADATERLMDSGVGTPLALAAMVRGLG